MDDNLAINRLVTLHVASHHTTGLGATAKTSSGKRLWQPLAKLGLIDRGSAQYCGVIAITVKGRELLKQPHDQIARVLGIDQSAVTRVLAMGLE